ncbi:hypothetical protein SAMN04487989_105103 [Bizionia echini]|uniref:Uncharacterized protein n=1 Tax=Bizionia echini TaxID=649333 RepID=A0A1I5CIK9_9FLAO|nr:DUF6090 family protein [Bizionia echini]SFN86850.1 hypothetical protein SAMN04487989_105103 [Bizionia echini]
MIKTHQVNKYLLYAIGEIILVVIGILIALQINNWNELRQSKTKERQYIDRLLSENKQDLITFSDNIKILEHGKQSIITFSEALKSHSISNEALITSANNYFKFGSIYPVFTASTSTFDDLSSTGNLQLITNIHLRDSIVNHYAKHKHVAEWIAVATNWALPLDAPFTYENDVMRFEPNTAFLFPDNHMETLATHLKTKKLKYISNAAAHYWINMDAITNLEKLINDTELLINQLKNSKK